MIPIPAFLSHFQVPELSVTHPGAYMGVFDSDDATLGVFVIKENYTLPLHDHPSMHGFVKVILGKVKGNQNESLILL